MDCAQWRVMEIKFILDFPLHSASFSKFAWPKSEWNIWIELHAYVVSNDHHLQSFFFADAVIRQSSKVHISSYEQTSCRRIVRKRDSCKLKLGVITPRTTNFQPSVSSSARGNGRQSGFKSLKRAGWNDSTETRDRIQFSARLKIKIPRNGWTRFKEILLVVVAVSFFFSSSSSRNRYPIPIENRA